MKPITFGLYIFLLFNVGNGKLNVYGDGYGVEWIFFPDGDGYLHFVNLTEEVHDANVMLRSNSDIDIEYRLYTRNNKDTFELIDNNGVVQNEICEKGCFKPNAPVKLVTHGWMSAADRSAVMLIKDAYLKKYDYNVIGVDWASISINFKYPFVAKETKQVGNLVGRFLKAMTQKYGIKGEQIHLIGHSLGAHVMGNAAVASGLKIGRITGLDPARPLFEFPLKEDKSERLDPSDAEFVDIVHTCGGVLGVEGQYGHADFYPNSGAPPQPGCSGFQAMLEACSHGRAHAYFAEAIEKPHGFPSHKCKDWNEYITNKCDKNIVYMGENVDKNLRGSYYLSTNAYTPFALNNF